MPEAVEVRIDGCVRDGTVIDLPAGVEPSRVLAAIRGNEADGVRVDSPPPGPVHEHVGYIHGEMGIRARTALARAGRSRGLTTEYDERIATIEAEIEHLDSELAETDPTEPAQFREAIADHQTATTERREAVAAARGRVRACREHDFDTDAAVETLEAAISELAEHETAETATRERLDRVRSQRRERRDLREKRFRLEDRLANLQREARAALVERLREELEAAVEAVPGESSPAAPFDAPPVVVALAVARTATLDAPVLLDCDRFDSPETASEWLGAPVLKV